MFRRKAAAPPDNRLHGSQGARRAAKNPDSREQDHDRTSNELWSTLALAGPRVMRFPHARDVSNSFGPPFTGNAVYDPKACRSMGAPAFTTGDTTHFESTTPPLDVAAHEATHQLQHAGHTNDQGLGPEGHAGMVARLVTEHKSARPLLGKRGAPVASATRPYTSYFSVDDAKIGEASLAETLEGTPEEIKVGGQHRTVTTRSQEAYADPALMREANATLEAKDSGVRLYPGKAGPNGIAKVQPNFTLDPTNKYFYEDCGWAAREVIGRTGRNEAPYPVYRDPRGEEALAGPTANPWYDRNHILMRAGLGKTPEEARDRYEQLEPHERLAIAKKLQINQYADPKVGEAFAWVTGTQQDEDRMFHWAGVVMSAGNDRVTLENIQQRGPPGNRNQNWFFDTHATEKGEGEPFHPFGTVTMLMRGRGRTTPELIDLYQAAPTELDRKAVLQEMRGRWLQVHVFVNKAQEDPDDVYVHITQGGKEARSEERSLSTGETHNFYLPLDKFLPLAGGFFVSVYDWDHFYEDDRISYMWFGPPYKPWTSKKPRDSAVYHTTIGFMH